MTEWLYLIAVIVQMLMGLMFMLRGLLYPKDWWEKGMLYAGIGYLILITQGSG